MTHLRTEVTADEIPAIPTHSTPIIIRIIGVFLPRNRGARQALPFSVTCNLSSALVTPLEGLEELSARVAGSSLTLVLVKALVVVVEEVAEVSADRLIETMGAAMTLSLLSSDES
ncbi:hypothetical protein E2C01_022539 [Portunus trituberculatus]|uniref:Uncharacterized protein n=1 Tax=Portunus trituberculatus TaxID=210409 RepID=A0A5B7E869_PORTR|nr:hypothetical protein [Portunus trituberculatus]